MMTNSSTSSAIYFLSIAVMYGCGDPRHDSQLDKQLKLSDYVVFQEIYDDTAENFTKNFIDPFTQVKATNDNLLETSFDTIIINNIVYYIVEGDMLLNKNELKPYFFNKNVPSKSRKMSGMIRNGEIVKIENPTNIRYSIIKESFSDIEYKNIVNFFNIATMDWSKMCNVAFNHIIELDPVLTINDNPVDLTFVVHKKNSKSGLLASSFFPYYEKERRRILITPKFFKTTYNKPGILRHEIGHILGFRHEHIRSDAPAVCPKKEKDIDFIKELTQYDPQSVMHYFCGGVGSKELKFTKIDSIGASMIYK